MRNGGQLGSRIIEEEVGDDDEEALNKILFAFAGQSIAARQSDSRPQPGISPTSAT